MDQESRNRSLLPGVVQVSPPVRSIDATSPARPLRRSWAGVVLSGSLLTGLSVALAELRFHPHRPVSFLDEGPLVLPPADDSAVTWARFAVFVAAGVALPILLEMKTEQTRANLTSLLEQWNEMRNRAAVVRFVAGRHQTREQRRRVIREERGALRIDFDKAEAQERKRIAAGQAQERQHIQLVEQWQAALTAELAEADVLIQQSSLLAQRTSARWQSVRSVIRAVPAIILAICVFPIWLVKNIGRAMWQVAASGAAIVADALSNLLFTSHGQRRLAPVIIGAFALVAFAAAAALLGGCGEPRTAAAAIVLDTSSSGYVCANAPCQSDAISHTFQAFAELSRLPAGALFRLFLVGEDLRVPTLYTRRAPVRWAEYQDIEAAKGAHVRSVLSDLSKLIVPTNGGSAVTLAVWRAAQSLRQSGATDRYLFIISDLRDQRHDPKRRGVDRWYLAHHVPEDPEQLVTWLREDGSLPDLAGVHVIVCGVHLQPTPGLKTSWDPKQQQHLVALFERVFIAAHAASIHIGESCDPHDLVAAGLSSTTRR